MGIIFRTIVSNDFLPACPRAIRAYCFSPVWSCGQPLSRTAFPIEEVLTHARMNLQWADRCSLLICIFPAMSVPSAACKTKKAIMGRPNPSYVDRRSTLHLPVLGHLGLFTARLLPFFEQTGLHRTGSML